MYLVRLALVVSFGVIASSSLCANQIDSSSTPDSLIADVSQRFEMVVEPFRTPVAGLYEARIAMVVQPVPKKLRLDIGASVDLLRPRVDSARPRMWIGADFMTYTRLRAEHNLKFPVETIDYWFGIHASYSPIEDFGLRLRAAHISSHLVDGLADTSGLFQVQKPFVYSREFLELLCSYNVLQELRLYAGATVLTSTQPRTANRIIPQGGFDVDIPISSNALGRSVALRGGFDWRLIGVNGTYVTAQAAQVGVFFETGGEGSGLMFSLNGYNGRSMHGMFYNQGESYIGFSMQIVP